MKIRNVSPMGDLDVPLLGRVVELGETFEVAAEVGDILLDQPYHFKPVKAPAKAPAKPTTKKEEGETK